MYRFLDNLSFGRRLLLVSLALVIFLAWTAIGGFLMLKAIAARPIQITPTALPPVSPVITAAANPSGGFTITGFNWPANDFVQVGLVPPSGGPVYWLGTLQCDTSGAFRVDFEWQAGQPSGNGTQLLASNDNIKVTAPFNLVPSFLPTIVPTETPLPPTSPAPGPSTVVPPSVVFPVCFVAGDNLNLRTGPGTGYGITRVLLRGEELKPIARNADGTWIQVITVGDFQGWVANQFVTCYNLDLVRLPVVNVPPAPTSAPPTPTMLPTATPLVITDWRGEYFDNVGLAGTPRLVRNDVYISFDWGTGSPTPGLPADNFGVRWTRWQRFAAGTYRFYVRVDDGARLYVDNRLVLDMWSQGGARTQTVDLNLAGGDHSLQVDYFEAGVSAAVSVWWEQLGAINAWKGEYFGNRDLSGAPVVVRDDADISFNWGIGAPAPGLPSDDFSARWTRSLDFQSGTYRFSLRADDGVRLWVDGHLLIDEWHIANTTYAADIYLGGGRHRLRLDYFEATGNATVVLDWERLGPDYPDWKGEYYNNEDLAGDPVLVRNDVAIDFNWGKGSPASSVSKNSFSVRWTGRPELKAGPHRFYAESDDGIRVWVNGVLVIDGWDSPGSYAANMTISSGGQQKIRVEYVERSGEARIHFWWEYAGPTPVPPTPTATVVPPTPVPPTPIPPTPTATVVPPTPTATVVPPTPTATVVPPTPTATSGPYQPVAFRTVAQGMQGYGLVWQPVYKAFWNANEWNAFMEVLLMEPGDKKLAQLPGVNWSSEIVLAAFLGDCPDSSISVQIARVERGLGKLVVTVKQVRESASAPVPGTPFHIVAVKRADLPNNPLEIIFVDLKGNPLGGNLL